MTQPIPWRQTINQAQDTGGDVPRQYVGGGLGREIDPTAERGDIRRWRRIVNGYVEAREDGACLPGRHGAGQQELLQGWSGKISLYDATAPTDSHFVEHLWSACGQRGAGHACLVPREPLRAAGLEQFYHLAGCPDMDVGRGACVDLFPHGPAHRPSYRPLCLLV